MSHCLPTTTTGEMITARMTTGRLLTCFLFLLVSLCAFPASADLLKIETNTNLRAVYLFPDTRSDLIEVHITLLAGEVDNPGTEGLSHYLEHLMFWHADDYNKNLHGRGGNAWVNGLVTDYYNSADRTELENMFSFVSKILTKPEGNLAFMAEERHVVNREYDLRLSENPERQAYDQMRKVLYGNNPVGRSVIGNPKGILSLNVDQAIDFYNTYYHASNAVLVIAGNVGAEEVKQLVNKAFAGVPAGTENPQLWRSRSVSGTIDETLKFYRSGTGGEQLVYLSLADWAGNKDPMRDYYTALMTSNLLMSALEGGLAKPLRLDNFVLREFDLGVQKILHDQVEFALIGWTDEGVTPAQASNRLRQSIKDLAATGVPEKTLQRLRKRALQTARRNQTNGFQALWRGMHLLSVGLEPNSAEDHINKLGAVSKADVDQLLKQ